MPSISQSTRRARFLLRYESLFATPSQSPTIYFIARAISSNHTRLSVETCQALVYDLPSADSRNECRADTLAICTSTMRHTYVSHSLHWRTLTSTRSNTLHTGQESCACALGATDAASYAGVAPRKSQKEGSSLAQVRQRCTGGLPDSYRNCRSQAGIRAGRYT